MLKNKYYKYVFCIQVLILYFLFLTAFSYANPIENIYSFLISVPWIKVIKVFILLLIGYLFVRIKAFDTPLLKQFKEMGGDYEDVIYMHESPFGASIEQLIFALDNGGQMVKKDNIIGAYILRMVQEKALVMHKVKNIKSSGEIRETVYFKVNRYVMLQNRSCQELFDLIISAAGVDNILQPNELKQWARRNAHKLQFWFDTVRTRGDKGFRFREGYYVNRVDTKLGISRGYTLTDEGYNLIIRSLGYKKYLEDFTLLDERETREVELWDDYLVFATLFGIAETVAKEMNRVYPDFANISTIYNFEVDIMSVLYMTNRLNSAISSGYNSSSPVKRKMNNLFGSSKM